MTGRAPTKDRGGSSKGPRPSTAIARLPGWQVMGSHVEGGRLSVRVATDTRPDGCPSCRAETRDIVKMGVVGRRLAEAPLAGMPTVLIVSRRRFRCTRCETAMAQPLPLALESHRMTLRCRDHVVGQGGLLPAAQIARQVGIHHDTVRSLLAEAGVVPGKGRPRLPIGQLQECGFCLRAFTSAREVEWSHHRAAGIAIPSLMALCPSCNRQRTLDWLASNDTSHDRPLTPARDDS